MLLVRLICSDPECVEEHEVVVNALEELDGFTCECGFGLVVASVSEAEPVEAHVAGGEDDLPLAA
jgi:hypothetical protein